MSCLYYAFGGGLGHVVRCVAIARQVARLSENPDRSDGGPSAQPIRQRILVNTPFTRSARELVAQTAGLELQSFSSDGSPAEALAFVRRELVDFDPRLLVVDTFPRGLGGEFAQLFKHWDCSKRILIARHLPDDYLERFGVRQFVARNYDRVIVPAEQCVPGNPRDSQDRRVPSVDRPLLDNIAADIEPDKSVVIPTAPITIRSSQELSTVETARKRLRLGRDETCVLFVGCGTQDECDEMAQTAAELASNWPAGLPPIRLAWPADFDPPFDAPWIVQLLPVLDVISAVRLVVGNAGYNLSHETRVTGVPAILIPRPRLYDNQRLRSNVDSLANLKQLRESIIDRIDNESPLFNRDWPNGAEQAASIILNELRQSEVP